MFDALELFVGQIIALEPVVHNLTALKYTHASRSLEEGEFSVRGGILEVFPAGFDSALRVDFDDEKIKAIASVNNATGRSIWQHKMVIILPYQARASRSVFNAEIPLNSFIWLSA